MKKLLTQNAAIAYLRNVCGAMSIKVFQEEVRAGRIPQKPFGKTVRYRQEDLDKWCDITKVHSDYSNVAKSGTRTSRSLFRDSGLSFAKVLDALTKPQQKNTVQNACAK